MNLLQSYQNGNVNVSIYDDGTKIRQYEGKPFPLFPENIDVKITNWCDAGCKWCSECSNVNGKHCNVDKLLKVLSPLPAGTEISIGGGNCLAHPELNELLTTLKANGLIASITVNQKHIYKYHKLMTSLVDEGLVKGVGVSVFNPAGELFVSDNSVFHLIAGVNHVDQIAVLNERCKAKGKKCKVLVLGYKQYGLGESFYSKEVEESIKGWKVWLPKYFKKDMIISFDNAAIKQLDIRRFFTQEGWNKFYMGDDFQFSCYIDAVEEKFAQSSASKDRVSFNNTTLLEYFKK